MGLGEMGQNWLEVTRGVCCSDGENVWNFQAKNPRFNALLMRKTACGQKMDWRGLNRWTLGR